MHSILITGTSRGIGRALVEALSGPETHLFCVSRSVDHAWLDQIRQREAKVSYTCSDLSDSQAARDWVAQVLDTQSVPPDQISCIHNAAMLHPIGAIGSELNPEQLNTHIQLNLLSPMLMTEALVAATQTWPIPKRMLYVSSGAARKPRHAWGAYCSSKAGLEMYARNLALEQATQAHPWKVLSLAPGVVDTAMQDSIRAQTARNFPDLDRFVSLKKEGKLWSPDFVAGHIVRLLFDPDFGQAVVQDLRDRV